MALLCARPVSVIVKRSVLGAPVIATANGLELAVAATPALEEAGSTVGSELVRTTADGAPRRHAADDSEEITGGTAAAARLRNRTIVLDCRWLGMGGAGRVTELLLREFKVSPPPGEWILWGRRDRIEDFAFEGATLSTTDVDPRSLMGQRLIAAVPRGDVVVYLHQIRPLRPGPSVTVIHDTIQLRHGSGTAKRALKWLFLLSAARLSSQVLTDSELSRDAVRRDLRVPIERITVMRFPIDFERAEQIWRLRQIEEQQKVLLYLGRFDRHKNLHGLCLAFQRSLFARQGGRLLLVGGWEDEVEELRRWINVAGIRSTDARGKCSEQELDQLLASSAALIMPSLEEGYGLPAFEAAATGLPVAVTKTGAMVDLPDSVAIQFDAGDLEGMARAIDEVTGRPSREPSRLVVSNLATAVVTAAASAL
jgi:glycosyltransferase involved in cell wall biosynthesis